MGLISRVSSRTYRNNMTIPSPTVLWSQTMTFARFTVKLQDVEKSSVDITLSDTGLLKATMKGTGASGTKLYEFAIPLDSEIFSSSPKAKYNSSYLEIKIPKNTPCYLK